MTERAGAATIFVVDDDPAVRRAVAGVGRILGQPVDVFDSAASFLESYHPDRPGCLVLDIRMPDMSGLELQQRLNAEHVSLPVIMISGHADVRMAVEAMRRGAVTLLEKPFGLDELIEHIRAALEQDRRQRAAWAAHRRAADLLARLTPREQEVLTLVLAGMTNKQIAANLDLSLRAVEDRRARLMRKLQVPSLAELVSLARDAELTRITDRTAGEPS